MLTSADVIARAETLGFDRCGVAPATGLPELGHLHEWLARGHAGEMTYLARSADVRSDIRAVLPSAQSVIMTATSYWVGETPGTPTPAVAVARYARGRDYHEVLHERLEALLAWMRTASDTPFEASIFVDKHQVQERVFAYHAGLGGIGKHSLLIDRAHGSWLLLAGMACSLPLTPTGPQTEDLCGSCTLCLDACPTGAIVAPRDVDARRCVAYLTIELDGPIPEPQRASVGTHLFGCDVCQDVCPWNLAPLPTADPVWQPQAGRDAPDPRALWLRPDDALHAFVAGSAMTRTALSRLRRNLAIAIGECGDPSAADVLDRPGGGVRNAAPSAEAPIVREAVAWAKARLLR